MKFDNALDKLCNSIANQLPENFEIHIKLKSETVIIDAFKNEQLIEYKTTDSKTILENLLDSFNKILQVATDEPISNCG